VFFLGTVFVIENTHSAPVCRPFIYNLLLRPSQRFIKNSSVVVVAYRCTYRVRKHIARCINGGKTLLVHFTKCTNDDTCIMYERKPGQSNEEKSILSALKTTMENEILDTFSHLVHPFTVLDSIGFFDLIAQ